MAPESGAASGRSTVPRRLLHSASGHAALSEIDDPQLFAWARRLFNATPAGVEHPEPTQPAVSVVTTPSGFEVAAAGTLVTCDCRTDALAVLEHALTDALLSSCVDYVHVHASGAVVDGRAVLALGGSGAGKSSLALAWLLHGFPSLGDDVALLDREGWARPFQRLFKVDPALLESFDIDPVSTPFWDATTGEAWYAPADGIGWARPAPVAVVAVCNRSAGTGLSVEPLRHSEGLNALLHSRMPGGLDAASSFAALAAAAGGARMLRVHFSCAREAATAIVAHLG